MRKMLLIRLLYVELFILHLKQTVSMRRAE